MDFHLFSDSQRARWNELKAKEKKLLQTISVEQESIQSKPPSYLLDRYTNSVSYHKRRLETLKNEYEAAIKKEEDELQIAEQRLETERSRGAQKSKILIRAQKELEEVTKEFHLYFPSESEKPVLTTTPEPPSQPPKPPITEWLSAEERELQKLRESDPDVREREKREKEAKEKEHSEPASKPVLYTQVYHQPEVEERPPIISNTKVKKPKKDVLIR